MTAYAIHITEQNIPKIASSEVAQHKDLPEGFFRGFGEEAYFLYSWDEIFGEWKWTVIPARRFMTRFLYDAEKIKTEFTPISRKTS